MLTRKWWRAPARTTSHTVPAPHRSSKLRLHGFEDRIVPASLSMPSAIVAVEDTPLTLSGASAIHFDDTGLTPGGLRTVTLSVEKGFLSLGSDAGLIYVGSSVGSPIAFSGSTAAINAALQTARFTPWANANGNATFAVEIDDDDPAHPQSVSGSVNIAIAPVNDLPTMTFGGVPAVDEDAPAVRIPGFVQFSPGPASATDELGQTAIYTVTLGQFTGNLAFAVPPAIDASGTLTYTLAPDAYGSAVLHIVGRDSEMAPGTGATANLTLVVRSAIDAPDLTLSAPVTLTATGELQMVPGFASYIRPTASDDVGGPAYTVRLENVGPGVRFVEAPSISTSGSLYFIAAPGSVGSVDLVVGVRNALGSSATHRTTLTLTAPVAPPTPVPVAPPAPTPTLAIGSFSETSGRVQFASSAGTVTRVVAPFGEGFRGGLATASGDFNGDGVEDVVVGAGPTAGPRVVILDGITGQMLRGPLGSFYAYDSGFTGGVNIATGDIDGDGLADLVTATKSGGGPHIEVYSGRTGDIIYSFYAYESDFHGGVSIAVADTDGDGKADIITAAGPGGGPHVRVFSGATGAMISSFYAEAESFRGGLTVTAGDLDGDGKAEIVATPTRSATEGSRVAVFDLAGNRVNAYSAFETGYAGGVVISTSDIDRDGARELLVTGSTGGRSVTRAFKGLTHPTVLEVFDFDQNAPLTGGIGG